MTDPFDRCTVEAVASKWAVYMLRCADGSLYSGMTNDLDARVSKHNSGKGARYTRSRLPVKLVWSRRVKDLSAALKREAKLKALTRAEKLKLLSPAAPKKRAASARR